MDEFGEFARLAQAAYTGKAPDGFEKVQDLSDRRSKVFKDEENRVVISFRGTDPLNPSDLWADAHILTGTRGISPRFREASAKFQKVKQSFPEGSEIYVTGHSLGGAQAKYIAQNESSVSGAFLFNPGSNPWYDSNLYSPDPRIQTFTTGSDPISVGSFFQRNENVTRVSRKPGMDPHSMSNFLD